MDFRNSDREAFSDGLARSGPKAEAELKTASL
jgi:hypothetical protein